MIQEYFKHQKDFERTTKLHPIALMIFFDMLVYCDEMGHKFLCTSTVSTLEEDIELKRSSGTHRTGRAFDLSVRGWSSQEIALFIEHFESKYKHYGAVTYPTQTRRLIVNHVGTARHLHVQIHSKYTLAIEW